MYYVCMYGPVSRVPESVSLGDHTIGGGRDPESGLVYIYIYITAPGVLTYSLTRFFTIFLHRRGNSEASTTEFAVSTTLVKSTKHDTSKHGHLHSG